MSSSTASLASTEDVRINQPTSPEAMALIDRVAACMEQHAYEAARQVTAAEDTLILSRQAFASTPIRMYPLALGQADPASAQWMTAFGGC